MNLLSRRSVLAIAAVVDVALHSRSDPVSAKALAARHKLPSPPPGDIAPGAGPRQNSQGLRGPRGGYELARERRRITVGEIVRTAMSLSSKRDLTAAGRYAAIACEPALVHFQGSSSSIFVLG